MSEIKEITNQIIQQKGTDPSKVIPILQAVQENFNFLPEEAIEQICENTEITPSQIMGVATFYNQFRLKPAGKHTVRVCVGTACHVKGADLVYDSFHRHFKMEKGEDTDTEGNFTLEKVSCLGCCTLAPVVQIDDFTYGHVQPEQIEGIVKDFLTKEGTEKKPTHENYVDDKDFDGEIRLGLGSCCIASGSADVQNEIEKSLEKSSHHINIKHVGCVGMCHNVPLLEIVKPDTEPAFYAKVDAKDVSGIVKEHFPEKNLLKKLSQSFNRSFEHLLTSEPTDIQQYALDIRENKVAAFLDKQIAITTELRGDLKPADLEEYKEKEGFEALQKCLQKNPEDIIDTILKSRLRGRGGAGFPTGRKWKIAFDNKSNEKYLICNGDEGDPGAFMDRMLLESYPFRIIEGMLIAAFAVQAQKGFFYIRAEYPLAVKRIQEALEICKNNQLIGNNILGSSFNFEIEIFEGAGAFVCGEETALISSMEGKRGMPTIRPPFPVEKGFEGKPTLVNNAETLATVPWIIREGDEGFNSIGTKESNGTKVFALAGKINRGGLIEVPMGITIREIVEQIGGGISDGKTFKAVQIGGPSGGCLPASMADTSVDFESLDKAGAMMGSGGLVVLDESDCMVDIARYFLSFTQDQSCGKCTFCRIGTKRMLEILEKICDGKGTLKDIDQLEKLAHSVQKGSLCGLGKTAPNPVLTTLQYFREEYEAHINVICPAKKCKNLIQYEINEDCYGCTKCAQKCPVDAIPFTPHEIHEIIQEECIQCDTCRQVCPVEAVIVNSKFKI